jgi:hypothetical protein
MALKKLTNGKKQNLSDLCKCGKFCGGYCVISRKMSCAIRNRIIDYLESDVRELWEALGYFQNLASKIGLELGMTIGSTSWKSAKKELGLAPQPYGDSRGVDGLTQWKFVRQSYFGGRSEIFRTNSDAGFQYDVNSMYPAKIATVQLPVEYEGKRYGKSSSKCYRNGIHGIYRARVLVPDSFIPPLPIRTTKRILYPTGQIEGTWTLIELQAAESKGCKIESISEAATFKRGEVLFKSWVDRLFKIRSQFGKDTREGYWLKLVMNSLTGKFGAKIKHRSYILDPCFGTHCNCGKAKIDDVTGLNCVGNPANSRVWFREYERIPNYGHVEWSAYLTSAARITLHDKLTESGKDDAVYCDTDGLFSEKARKKNIGDALGQWQNKGKYEDFIALAPKVYCYHQDNGAKIVRAKGIPNPVNGTNKSNQEFWKKLIESKPIEYWSIAGLRNPHQGMFFVRRFLSRKVTPHLGGRLPDKDGKTLPPRASDIESFR